jgi:hypothetical protein
MSREGSGDYAGAESAARTSRIFIWVSFGLGLAVIIIYVLFFLLLGIGAALF